MTKKNVLKHFGSLGWPINVNYKVLVRLIRVLVDGGGGTVVVQTIGYFLLKGKGSN